MISMSEEEKHELALGLVKISILREEITTVQLAIPFYSESDAKIAYNSLRIDKEPPRGNVVKELSVKSETLLVKFSSKDLKRLKSSITSFLDYTILVVKTLQKFGPSSKKETEKQTE
ncbi:EKC/KEOPS complex subunit LAGE3-like [Argiope bruennichi]|uniref:L antigen family member 3 n=1 Tax=Argiope bruennichi TaxID=94029 RepID=A0A8T0EFV2_ARGBR|nr:EKC/KEOPS complex subunit LAGE3-like [Argiope bruennichi]KAF8771811.1 EKC/KEOPS complex subunit LAGE3 like protein [Argiope bruennichi]